MTGKRIEKFTPSQEVGLEKLTKFLKTPIKKDDVDTRVFVLKGKAGTGKTTLIRYALESEISSDMANCSKEDSDFGMFAIPNVIGVTMSHKAKQVLGKSIHIVRTYAAYFGLKQHYREDGSIEFIKDAYLSKMADCSLPVKVVVHDECSMYDMAMIKNTLEETSYGTKIIFMGDPGQLPPINAIGDEDSPIFSMFSNSHTLEERVRQTEGNPIIDLSDIIYSETFGTQKLHKVYDAFRDEKIIDGKGFNTIMYNEFLKDYKKSSDDYLDSKVVAYRNDKVNMFNSIIRNHIHNKPDFKFIVGEIIYMNDSYYHQKKGSRTISWVCYNSDEYKIIDIKRDVIDDIDVYLLYIDKTGHMQLAGVDNPYIPVVAESGEKKYKEIVFWRRKQALEAYGGQAKQKWKYYYDFINKFGNVSYGYCYTGYKAQGSTFKNIFIDVNDIVTVGPISDKRKLQALYTGVTRASHLVSFLKTK